MRNEASMDSSPPTQPAPLSRSWLSSIRRPKTSPGPKPAPQFKRSLLPHDDDRRDSALASCLSTASVDRPADLSTCMPAPSASLPSLPAIVVQSQSPSQSPAPSPQHESTAEPPSTDTHAFSGLDTFIPTGSMDELASPTNIEFSKRGSMLLGGQRANTARSKQLAQLEAATAKEKEKEQEPERPPTPPSSPPRRKELTVPTTTPPRAIRRSPSKISQARMTSLRVLSADETMLSRKVRSMYKHGDEKAADWDDLKEQPGSARQSFVDNSSISPTPVNGSTLSVDNTRQNDFSSSPGGSNRHSLIEKEPMEAAGGVEDWTDLEGAEVDRYGFIVPKKSGSRESNDALDGPEAPGIQRVSTALKLVSEEPRGKRRLGRSASKARTNTDTTPPKRSRSQKSKPAVSIYSNRTTASRGANQNPFRYAANRLPHNRDRRFMDEASDMLTLPPGLAEIAAKEDGGKLAAAMRAKEIEREEKWRKMAKVVNSTKKGGGMMFEFDTKDQKLISRTWKGIPDRWRATAWYAFLAASAKNDEEAPSDEELIESFYELQEESSADDMQIDVDVPRTINRHIMFRRKYRGGQRLLFRVLHAMSIYLPETGYVQGMAALAATLLCYYEEDKAFVMLVRLWQYRGLERLYEAGFAGLMEALDDFEKNWLRGGDVAKKLEELGITSTAYGTRWYLTLFNYSLPFPAQLRVWDVFMLLGGVTKMPSTSPNSNSPGFTYRSDLDVLHATSAALIDATREILLDSDFENAMKVLTSWIPIKDEDLLMRVAKAEYKMRKKRALQQQT